jgi:predicted DsbA family dithiol-disulfide isomerase
MAMESPYVKADVIEANEFPSLSEAYGISGVPTTIIGDVVAVVGSMPEQQFVEQVKEALKHLQDSRHEGHSHGEDATE